MSAFSKENSPYSLKELKKKWTSQARRLVEIGCHKALGMTEEEYLKSLPKFSDNQFIPKSKYRQHVDFSEPLLVETRLTFEQLAKLAEMNTNNLHIEDYRGNHALDKTEIPYIAWTEKVDVDQKLKYAAHGPVIEERITLTGDEFDEGDFKLVEAMNWIIQNTDEWITYTSIDVPLVDEDGYKKWITLESKYGKTDACLRFTPVEF